jgi:hypothetical protein
MITLPSSPDETFGNDYTLRSALGEWLRRQACKVGATASRPLISILSLQLDAKSARTDRAVLERPVLCIQAVEKKTFV